MTFTSSVKEEIIKNKYNKLDYTISLNSYLKFSGEIDDMINITTENPSIATWLFKGFKEVYNINLNLRVIISKNKKSFILTSKEKINKIKENITNDYNNILGYSNEEKAYFLKGLFLVSGNITDPKNNLYHLEVVVKTKEEANLINKLFTSLNISSNSIIKNNEYMIYIKKSEKISDFLKYINAYHSLFYFEDIRIYKDHKNMVNRINNCEQANTEKSYKASMEVVDNINYLKNNDLFSLLSDRGKEVAEYKMKYPETTINELAEVISHETNQKIGKSGVYHHIRNIKKIVNQHKNK